MKSLKIFVALGAAVTMMMCVAAAPASAITAELAKKCRAMALNAYPYKLVGHPGPGNAQAQRSYFSECVKNQGDMPAQPTGTAPDDNGQKSAPPE